MRRWNVITRFVVGAAICCLTALPVAAATISIGTRIPIAADAFALPIEILDGANVTGWQFDLTYDPSDVQVNTACDPFSDPYCSLFTGAVTEGNFFASGAPFNLLTPGFVDLDPMTLAQTGLLLGVTGAFGGSLPFPSGNGALAFVEFTLLGTGASPIDVQGTTTPVPEPATLALLMTGALFLAVTRRRLRRSGP